MGTIERVWLYLYERDDIKMHGACLLLMSIPFYQETGSRSHSFCFVSIFLSFSLLISKTLFYQQ